MIAVLDACVLYPPSLRDLLMWLAVTQTYEPRWSEEIHAEWIRNVLADRPEVTTAQLERTRRLMDRINPKSLVSGYEVRTPKLSLPDPDDRHVLAVAIEAGAAVIVTFNLSDFPRRALAEYGVRPLSPDAFLDILFDQQTVRFLRGIQKHRASLKSPSKTAEEYLTTLKNQRLNKVASRLEAHREAI
jgi:predicted nucleic acid-binding protein